MRTNRIILVPVVLTLLYFMVGIGTHSVTADYHEIGSESFGFQLSTTGEQWTNILYSEHITDDIVEIILASGFEPVNFYILDTTNYHECINHRPFLSAYSKTSTLSVNENWTVPITGEQWYVVVEGTSSVTTNVNLQITWFRWYDPDAKFVEREIHEYGYPGQITHGNFTIHNDGQETARGQVRPVGDHRPEINIAFDDYGFDIAPGMSQTFNYTIEIAPNCRVITFVKQIEFTYYGPNIPVDTINLFIHVQHKPLIISDPLLSFGIIIGSFAALLGYWVYKVGMKRTFTKILGIGIVGLLTFGSIIWYGFLAIQGVWPWQLLFLAIGIFSIGVIPLLSGFVAASKKLQWTWPSEAIYPSRIREVFAYFAILLIILARLTVSISILLGFQIMSYFVLFGLVSTLFGFWYLCTKWGASEEKDIVPWLLIAIGGTFAVTWTYFTMPTYLIWADMLYIVGFLVSIFDERKRYGSVAMRLKLL